MRKIALLLLLLTVPAFGGTRGTKWFRRITLATACVFATTDILTTVQGSRLGLRESSVFRKPDGSPNINHLVLTHTGFCAGFLAIEELLHFRQNDVDQNALNLGFAATNLALASGFAKASFTNWKLIRQTPGRVSSTPPAIFAAPPAPQ